MSIWESVIKKFKNNYYLENSGSVGPPPLGDDDALGCFELAPGVVLKIFLKKHIYLSWESRWVHPEKQIP